MKVLPPFIESVYIHQANRNKRDKTYDDMKMSTTRAKVLLQLNMAGRQRLP